MYHLTIRQSIANDVFNQDTIEVDMGNDRPQPIIPMMICVAEHIDPYKEGFLIGSVERDDQLSEQLTGFIYAFGKTDKGFVSAGCECAGVFDNKDDAEKKTRDMMERVFIPTTPISFWAAMKVREVPEDITLDLPDH